MAEGAWWGQVYRASSERMAEIPDASVQCVVLEHLDGGVLLARVLGGPALRESIGLKYKSHFATCRDAAAHRSPR